MSQERLEHLKQALAPELPLAWPASPWQGLYRLSPEDFQVEEDLGFEPEGQGEHLFLWVEKTGSNTAFVAEELAKRAGIHPRLVSFSGLKDRHAVTRQWFSLHLPGQTNPDLQLLEADNWTILKAARHPRKLKRGVHRGNHFSLRIRIDNADASTGQWLAERWKKILQEGVPNYFGPQRFGFAGQNLDQAWQWLERQGKGRQPSRQKKSLWLSSLRSALFNLWLAEQVESQYWKLAQEGSCFQLQGTRSFFSADQEPLAELQKRLDRLDLHTTGPLAGKGKSASLGPALEKEEDFFKRWSEVVDFLADQGLHQERRCQRLLPEKATQQPAELAWEDPWLSLRFFLPTGSFATSLLRELIKAEDAAHKTTFIQ
ncbi:tRNA pseudouridine13 synthase [Marinospirillum celere]|uniref:tRNA pseudouridine synthase D n=1 Tax=Marinospirillum celere TaxID=1122252 RepID=A0A1I1ILE6_9GAMM|nr:tRNA pseudouridine(13) synthase TruD [Marinospirillum celere]SFC37149.1 tRNA pseudouridine13 synthase [Marinospirillum celere]